MKEETTEYLIKQSAKRLFFAKGRLNAKMHEIADDAGLNRALLHYYYRNRDNLFQVVLKEAVDETFIRMFSILSEEIVFEKKIEKAIHHIIDCLAQYPFIESFIISEINKEQDPQLTQPLINEGRTFLKKFLKEIEQYIKVNKIPHISPIDFIVNMMALCAYPYSTKPIVQNILGLSEKEYNTFVEKRKKMIVALVLMKTK
ncbi:MAG: TetR/AcrR family transcriptional regulator [Bacteroidota bacterium]